MYRCVCVCLLVSSDKQGAHMESPGAEVMDKLPDMGPENQSQVLWKIS